MSDEQEDDNIEPTIHIFGGGTIYHVRPHLALCAPAYGRVAREIRHILLSRHATLAKCHFTAMASWGAGMETNEDVAANLDTLIANPSTKVIFMAAALCDFEGHVAREIETDVDLCIQREPSGKDQPRLKTKDGKKWLLLEPAEKIISRIRKERKDIFLVGFKTTAGAAPKEQYEAGLTLLKKASCNLVLANDVHTRLNMVITPEQARYHETTDREAALHGLVEMTMQRSKLHFTRSTVVPGDAVSWSSDLVPESLRKVVNHCIQRGAYKPFLGTTVGHFAVKIGEGRFLTSRRRTDVNQLDKVGLVLVETDGDDRVIAHGSRPSVGGQSQRIVFTDHPGYDCIVHAHVPLRPGSKVPVRSQREFECGSHECGKNTSDGLKEFQGLSRDTIKAVMLDHHGPNIVFNRSADPQAVIAFIEENFDLTRSTDNF